MFSYSVPSSLLGNCRVLDCGMIIQGTVHPGKWDPGDSGKIHKYFFYSDNSFPFQALENYPFCSSRKEGSISLSFLQINSSNHNLNWRTRSASCILCPVQDGMCSVPCSLDTA